MLLALGGLTAPDGTMVQWKGIPDVVTLRLAMLSAECAVPRRPATVPLHGTQELTDTIAA